MLGKSKDFWVVNVGDHGAFVSAGFFGLLATGLYVLQVFFNIRLTLINILNLSRLTSHGTCGVVGGETKWIGARGSPPPFMIQVFIVNLYCHLFISQLILNIHRHPITVPSNFKYTLWLHCSGVSYQSSEPASPGFRPGTDPSLPPPHLVASVWSLKRVVRQLSERNWKYGNFVSIELLS